jgi:hypothetical protein
VAAGLIIVLVLALPRGAAAQETVLQDVAEAEEPVATAVSPSSDAGVDADSKPSAAVWADLLPEPGGATLAWIAVVVILVLTIQTKPLLSWHNFDGLMLALAALLLSLRDNGGVLAGDPTGQTVQWWSYLLLSVVGLYWLARGLKLLLSKSAPARGKNVSEGAMIVLVVAGLIVAGSQIVRAPISAGSRDGLIGGIFTVETGKLPFGDAIGHDARSPLLYLLHAGVVKLMPPTYEQDSDREKMTWANRAAWLAEGAWDTVDRTTVRLVNGLLFVLLLAALVGVGHRLHSFALGQALAVILCIFPGALECLARPEIMLPTTMLAWSIALVMVPGVGGLLSVLLLTLAGMAWPWAWLALPVVLGYFFRQGWHALGATVGLLGGVAVVLVGMTVLVAPSLPRQSGALAQAGIAPAYEARLSDDGTPVIDHHQPTEAVEPTLKSWVWRLLLDRDEGRLDSMSARPALPNGVDAESVRFRDVVATGMAREALQGDYRAALEWEPEVTRACASLRTLMEAIWKPEVQPAASRTGVWALWTEANPGSAGRWTLIRRTGKVVVGLLALLVAFVMIRGERGQRYQLIGGLLVVSAGTLLISMPGTATNWVWLMPAGLAALAASGGTAAARSAPRPIGELPAYDLGPAPRITVEK